jgi:hypothetical protein
VFSLAEIAYLFSLSKTIFRIDQSLIVLARDRATVLNRGSLSDGSHDETPAGHILVHSSAGQRKDEENIMFRLVKRVMDMGTLHHGGTMSPRDSVS